jgi:serine/threonine-protein kinase
MKRFHKSIIFDFRLGIILTLLALLAVFFFGAQLERLEYGLYDLNSRLRVKSSVAPVAVIAIDEKSLTDFGPWPWPRSYIAFMIDPLESYEAMVIGLDILYSEKDINHGLMEVLNIISTIENNPQYSKKNISTIVLLAALKDAEKRLDNDSILSNSIAMSKKVVLPLFFNLGNPIDKSSTSLPDYIENNSLPPGFFVNSITSREMVTPINVFAKDALGLGHINIIADRDGIVRSEPLFINFKDRLSPSFALQLTLKYLDLDLKDL